MSLSPTEVMLSDFLFTFFSPSIPLLVTVQTLFHLLLLSTLSCFSVLFFSLEYIEKKAISAVSVCQKKGVIKSTNGYQFLVLTDNLGGFTYAKTSFKKGILISLEIVSLNISLLIAYLTVCT